MRITQRKVSGLAELCYNSKLIAEAGLASIPDDLWIKNQNLSIQVKNLKQKNKQLRKRIQQHQEFIGGSEIG